MAFRFLHVVVPQGTPDHPKKEHLFEEVLVNLHNIVKNKTISLEFFGFNQYTYCYVVVPEELLETVEGLIYSTFPDCEIKPTVDYTTKFQPQAQAIVGTSLGIKLHDIYAIKTYDQFTEDSQSGLFSVISKIGTGEQAWVQIVINPKDETAAYHFKRTWSKRFANMRQKFYVRDWMRQEEGDDSIKTRRQAIAEKNMAKSHLMLLCVWAMWPRMRRQRKGNSKPW